MTEENMIQHLYDQVDRLVSMQNTMLTVVGALFAIIIGVFAFFQWRINQKDQDIIIKTAKEELIKMLIQNYNLLDINENRDVLKQTIDWTDRQYKDVMNELNELKTKQNNIDYHINMNENYLKHYLLIEEHILLYAEGFKGFKEIDNEKRDDILMRIKEFWNGETDGGVREYMANNLLRLLTLHAKEKIDENGFRMSYKIDENGFRMSYKKEDTDM